MLILGKQKKDYYDGVVGTVGVDKTIIYDRTTTIFEKSDIPKLFERRYWVYHERKKSSTTFNNLDRYTLVKNTKYERHSYFIIGFCGKLYLGWKLYSQNNEEFITEIIYDVDYMRSILSVSKYYGNIEDHLNYITNYNDLSLFRKYKTPIFVYDSDYERTSMKHYHGYKEKFIINPLLKDYEFYKVFDSFQAFQEIQMFMGGVLGSGEKIIPEIEDKYKIVQHGFDLKTSFRKDKK